MLNEENFFHPVNVKSYLEKIINVSIYHAHDMEDTHVHKGQPIRSAFTPHLLGFCLIISLSWFLFTLSWLISLIKSVIFYLFINPLLSLIKSVCFYLKEEKQMRASELPNLTLKQGWIARMSLCKEQIFSWFQSVEWACEEKSEEQQHLGRDRLGHPHQAVFFSQVVTIQEQQHLGRDRQRRRCPRS